MDPREATDEELARQTQAGSMTAFEELVTRYEHRVYAFVAQTAGHGVDAREVTQETFVKAYQSIDQFDCRRKFSAWLFTIARRKGIDHFRAAPPLADGPVPEQIDTGDPSELLSQDEERQLIWRRARRHLPEAQFLALWLKYAEELSVAEIAQVLRKTRTHVKVLLFRARQTLARELQPGAFDRASHFMFHVRTTQLA
jgi:RNA polymerase sigma-70 factor (ECF subfamily)